MTFLVAPALLALASYLLGSLSFGILYSRLRGTDVRARDLPGGSGIYRQYGLGAAVLVVALDVLKGVLAGLLAREFAPAFSWLAVLGVVLGHTYPLFFRFDGGGGIAPLLGAWLVLAPAVLGVMLLVAAPVMPLYKRLLQPRVGLNVIPATMAVVLPVGLLFASRLGSLSDVLAGGVALAVRALHLLRRVEA